MRAVFAVSLNEEVIISEEATWEQELEELEISREAPQIEYEIGDQVVYPHHGAGKVVKKEQKEVLGETREYLTIKILHNDMTVMVPCCNAGKAGLRRVIGEEDKGLSTGEKQMFTRAKKILASELMYALEMEEGEAEEYIDNLIEEAHSQRNGAAAAAN